MNFKNILFSLLSLTALFSQTDAYARGESVSSFKKPEHGWHWYEEKEEPLEVPLEEKPLPPPQAGVLPSSPYPFTEKNKEWQKQFNEAKTKAIYEPTPANVGAFQKLHRQMTDRAETFGKAWVLVNLQEGHLNPPQSNPNLVYRQVLKEQQDKALNRHLQDLKAQGFGLFFFSQEDCPYCQAFAPIVGRFAEQFDMEVLEISQGQGSGYFRQVSDNGIVQTLNPEAQYPLLYLMNTHTHEAYPLARGNTSLSQITQNLSATLEHINQGMNS